jgi:hypothetical protein
MTVSEGVFSEPRTEKCLKLGTFRLPQLRASKEPPAMIPVSQTRDRRQRDEMEEGAILVSRYLRKAGDQTGTNR